jgi:hypothetical protein
VFTALLIGGTDGGSLGLRHGEHAQSMGSPCQRQQAECPLRLAQAWNRTCCTGSRWISGVLLEPVFMSFWLTGA